MQNQTINANVATKRCPYCGETIPANVQKCSHCGEWLVVRYGNSWVKTLLLCGFFGGIGIHDFYNGKNGLGVAKILTFFGFCGIWPLIDFIMILCDAYTDSEGRKLSRKPTIGGTAVFCALGLLGGAGTHRFYTGHVALGFLQAFTLGGFFIWTIIDLILILTSNFKDANGNLIKG